MNSQETLSVSVLILRVSKYSEADLIITGLSSEFGKITMIARGALKSKKRFSGGILEATHFVKALIKKSRSEGGLATLHEASLLEPFSGLRTDYDRLGLALKLISVISRISQQQDPHAQDLYHLTGHALKVLQTAPDLSLFWSHFILRLLLNQGVLVQEPWMKVFLELPMAKHTELRTDMVQLLAQDVHERAQRSLDRYLETCSS